MEEKIENNIKQKTKRKNEKIVEREIENVKVKKENQIWDNDQETGREIFVVEEKLEKNSNKKTGKENF